LINLDIYISVVENMYLSINRKDRGLLSNIEEIKKMKKKCR